MAIFENKTDEAKKETQVAPSTTKVTAGFRTVLVQPRISEKAAKLSEAGKYVFNVAKNANKIEVKKAIEFSYKVSVTQVNMIRVEGKNRTFGKTKGSTSNYKKAIVTLKKGDKIEAEEAA